MALADLAARQRGVVATQQLQRLGYSAGAITRAASAGRLHRVHRGVYAVGHTRLTWHGRCLGAVLACAPNACASHHSAAWLWGLLGSRPAAVHVTTPTRRHTRKDIELHYARLAEDDYSRREGIPVTALPRTLLDLAAVSTPRRRDAAVERAERLRLFDLRPVEALLSRSAGHPGAGRLRRALALYRDEAAFTRSPLERRFLDLVRRAGLPPPSMNRFVEGYEVDAYWPDERFAVEFDGYAHHGTRAAFERDRRREEDLKLAGIEVLRVTHKRLADEPDSLAERIAALLERRTRK